MPHMMFKCKTSDAFRFKIMIELLANNLKTGCFEVNASGIYLRMFDNPRKTMVDLKLDAQCFSLYKFKYDSQFCMGLGLRIFHDMVRNIQKKDSLELFIDNENTSEIGIRRIPKEKTSMTTSMITIQKIQNIDIDTPKGYSAPFIVPSSEFKKMCSELKQINSKSIQVYATSSRIDFTVSLDRVLRRTVSFTRHDTDDAEEDSSCEEDDSCVQTYNATFSADQFKRIVKIAGLGTMIQIYPGYHPATAPEEELPLLFQTQVGTLGKISVYVKSIEMSEYEQRPGMNANLSDDDADEDSTYDDSDYDTDAL